ncbi:RNA polymerase sigma factor [Actinomadura kijaniata]|uniref:RNA polymerase sigma-70 factor (ECF subfamily) n=1 Tax=Actinomadura namibiensis TaxID=182080 RepID=A0A7W3QJ04_ACTNM|nr:RNA polymerase sigma factor [Actinomadura namibiensis]MBA8948866.1 RNA polymerase sigma-70 factor (ECF subfamily) [Actinomadura namibiensis]
MNAAAVRVEEADAADARLIEASVTDPERFSGVFERHHAEIHRYVARRVGVQAADDVVAETFLAAFRRRRSYDPGWPDARPWLYGIATTLVARHRRTEVRYLRAVARTGVDPLPEPLAERVVSRVAAQGEERALARGLAGLNRGDRDVLLLIAWADLTYEETSRALGIPVGTVRSRLSRARRRLRATLEEDGRG